MEPEHELKEIRKALHELVSAVIRDDDEHISAQREDEPSKGVRGYRILDRVAGTPAYRAAADLFDRPVREALRNGIRTLGERLRELGGPPAMEEALNDVAVRDPEAEDRRAALVNGAWHDIEGWRQ